MVMMHQLFVNPSWTRYPTISTRQPSSQLSQPSLCRTSHPASNFEIGRLVVHKYCWIPAWKRQPQPGLHWVHFEFGQDMEPSVDAFPPKPLTLSAKDERAIETLADRLVAETLNASRDFSSRGRVIDPTSWKVVKEKDNIIAYQELKGTSSSRDRFWSEDTDVVAVSPREPTFYPTSARSLQEFLLQGGAIGSLDDGDGDSEDERGWQQLDFDRFGGSKRDNGPGSSVLEQFRPEHTPVVISSGTFPGTIEDMALGFLADTDDRSRMRFNTKKEVLVDDMRILAHVLGPTRDDPFRFLGIKWCSHLPSRAVSLVVKPRDYVVIESTGISVDPNGQRFSYMLNHSIVLDEVPHYREFGQVRIVFSTCHIMRSCQSFDASEAVEVFSRGFMDAGGRFTARIASSQFAEGLLSVPGIMEEAYMKKLTWLLYREHLRSGSMSGTSDSTTISSSGGSRSMVEMPSTCNCCCGRLHSRVAGLLDRNVVCSLCRQTVCYKCSVKKSLPFGAAPGRRLDKKELQFCLNCFLKAKRLSAWHVAMSTLSKGPAEL